MLPRVTYTVDQTHKSSTKVALFDIFSKKYERILPQNPIADRKKRRTE